jgi:hypothetical protein
MWLCRCFRNADSHTSRRDACLRLKIPKSKSELKEKEDPYNILGYLKSLYQATGEFKAYGNALNIEKFAVFALLFL